MSFWIGQLITLVAGLVAIELFRNIVRQRYPAIKQYYFDLAGLALLVLGLGISAFVHLGSERQIVSLESQLQQVRFFEAIIRVRTAASWEGDTIPTLMAVAVDASRPIGLLDLQMHDGMRKLGVPVVNGQKGTLSLPVDMRLPVGPVGRLLRIHAMFQHP